MKGSALSGLIPIPVSFTRALPWAIDLLRLWRDRRSQLDRRPLDLRLDAKEDEDTVAAIARSLAGITCTRDGIPDDWIRGIIDRPHGVDGLSRLAKAVDEAVEERDARDIGFSWLLLPRGLVFTAVVLCHGFRRLLPPY